MFEYLFLMCAPLIHQETINSLVATESNYNKYAIAQIKGKSEIAINSTNEFIDKLKVLALNNKLKFKYNGIIFDDIDENKIDFSKDKLSFIVEWNNKSFFPDNRKEAELLIDELEIKKANYSVGLGQVNKGNFKKFNITGKELFNECNNLKISQSILLECFNNSPNKKVSEALSCYYSGNFNYGFNKEKNIGNSYLERIIKNVDAKPSVPSIKNEISFIKDKVTKIENQNIIKGDLVKKTPSKIVNIRSMPLKIKIKS